MKIRDIVASMPAWRARERIKAEMFRSAWLGAKVGAGIIALFLAGSGTGACSSHAANASGAPSW